MIHDAGETTDAQRLALKLLAEGLTVEEIAQRIGVTVNAIEQRLRKVFNRAGIGTHDEYDAPLSPQIRTYLYAFEQLVRARDDEEKRTARLIMDRAAVDAGLPLSRHHDARSRDLVDLLRGYALGRLKAAA